MSESTFTPRLTLHGVPKALFLFVAVLARASLTSAATLPVSYWPFDDGSGTTAVDVSGHGNTGTLINGPTWATGKVNSAVQFDGANDYIDAGNGALLNPANQITIAAWVKPSLTSRSQFIVAKDALPSGSLQYFLRLQGTAVRFAVKTSADNFLTTSNSLISANQWHHVAGVYDGTTMRVYLNGAQVGSPLNAAGVMANNGVNLRIGGRQDGALPFSGVIDEVRIYDQALSVQEVLDLYTQGMQDITPPSTPGNVSATAVSSLQINLTWQPSSDNVGVAGYHVHRQGIRIATTSTASYSDTGLTPNTTYTYTIAAFDAAGNTSPQSAQAQATTFALPDTTPPSVVVSNPVSGAKVSGRIAVSADASDNVGVAGVQFKLDGLNLGSEDTQTPYSVTWDTTLASEGPHTLTAVARDGVGNTTASTPVAVEVDNIPPIPANPVSYWPLDDGFGATAVDASGNGNTGTLIDGSNWTTGKINGAVQFDGLNDYIDAGNGALLNPANQITIAAWVKPSLTSRSQFVVAKDAQPSGSLQYFLRLQGTAIRFAIKTSVDNFLTTANSLISVNQWHHVAGVYDGTTMRIYLNGTQVGPALNATGVMANNGLNVRIGRRQDGLLPFSGMIDEVRMYDRAVTAQEMVALFTGTAPADITPPAVSITGPANGSVVRGTIALDVAASDNIAVRQVSLYKDGVLLYTDAQAPYQFIWSSGLDTNGGHTFTAVALDSANNATTSQAITLFASNGPAPRYDIVLILVDDYRFDAMQYMPLTSALLGNDSVKFSTALVAQPVCCPNRASIFSGLYSHGHGALENQMPQGGAQAFNHSLTIGNWLHQGGYRTGLYGRYLNDYEDILPRFIPPGWDDWHAGDMTAGNPMDYNYSLYENGVIVNYGNGPQDYGTDVLAARAVQFIETTPANQPLFVYFAPVTFLPAQRDVGSFASFGPWRPGSYNEADVSDKPAWVRQLPIVTNTTSSDAFHRQQLEALQSTDRAVASIIDALNRKGRLSNSAIVFTSDNGLAWGEHRIFDDKWCVYEECEVVPLWIRVPGIPGRIEDSVTVSVDFAPTFAEWAGVVPPRQVSGYSLDSILRDSSSPWNNERLVEYLGVSGGNGITQKRFRAIYTKQYVYAEYENGDREFYDRNADRLQLTNSINDPAYSAIIEQLARTLAAIRGF